MNPATNAAGARPESPPGRELRFRSQGEDTLFVTVAGSWTMAEGLPDAGEFGAQIDAMPQIQRIVLEAGELSAWDTTLLTFVVNLTQHCLSERLEVDRTNLPEGVRNLIDLAEAVPERDTEAAKARQSFLSHIGSEWLDLMRGGRDVLAFIGEATMSFVRLLVGRARFRASDFMLLIEECGAKALPIVTLISFLVGVILAFVGAVQLRQFGAQIFVADLVGLGMAREMAAMMVGIIMAGRTGAAFAAQLGTMTVNEEIDALVTMGISPMDFLVLPRMLALMLMMPLLCVYADILGILGGAAVSVSMLDVSAAEYFTETQQALSVTDFIAGGIKATIYGGLVAVAGCLRGMECGRSSAAVGAATTSAVVTSIVLIVVASSVLTVIYEVMGV